MIIGNTLQFGYGDIAMESYRLASKIVFYQFKPPMECGDTIITKQPFNENRIEIKFSYKDCEEFLCLLHDIEEHNKAFLNLKDMYLILKSTIMKALEYVKNIFSE